MANCNEGKITKGTMVPCGIAATILVFLIGIAIAVERERSNVVSRLSSVEEYIAETKVANRAMMNKLERVSESVVRIEAILSPKDRP